MAECSIDWCGKRLLARGWCAMHYKRWKLYGDPNTVKQKQIHGATLKERFEAYVIKGDGCWEWSGFRDPNGYGRLNIDGLPALAHRISFELYCEPISPEDHICHRCDNPPCVRPDHLFKGDHAANMADKMAKGRHRPGLVQGSQHGCAKLSDDQVLAIRADRRPPQDIAASYGVSRRTIRDILARNSWAHLPA